MALQLDLSNIETENYETWIYLSFGSFTLRADGRFECEEKHKIKSNDRNLSNWKCVTINENRKTAREHLRWKSNNENTLKLATALKSHWVANPHSLVRLVKTSFLCSENNQVSIFRRVGSATCSRRRHHVSPITPTQFTRITDARIRIIFYENEM